MRTRGWFFVALSLAVVGLLFFVVLMNERRSEQVQEQDTTLTTRWHGFMSRILESNAEARRPSAVIVAQGREEEESIVQGHEKYSAVLSGFPRYTTLSEDSRLLYADIVEHQFPPKSMCANRPKLLMPEWAYGLGSSLHVQSYALNVARTVNRTWVPVGIDTWKHFKDAKDDPACIETGQVGFSCYFEEVTSCSSTDLGIMGVSYDEVGKQVSELKDRSRNRDFWATHWNHWMGQDHRLHYPPDKFSAKTTLWYYSQMASFLFRLKPAVVDECHRHMEDMGFFKLDGGPVVGIHVRHGDKFMEAQPIPFAPYMQQLRAAWPEARRVYIATDDKYVLFDTFFNENYAEYEFMYIHDQRFEKKDHEKFRLLLCDIYILSECDGLVATMSSNLGRLAWELMHAKKPHARMVSMQGQWYPSP